MKKTICLALVLWALSIYVSSQTVKSSCDEIFYADPTIFVEDDSYYLLGTRNREPLGFTILKSKNLKKWNTPQKNKVCMILKQGNQTYGNSNFWAPQIFKENGVYYLAYTTDEQIVIAKSNTLLGPYTQERIEAVDESEKNIDPFVFKDEDGKFYLYFVRFNKGNYIWVAELDLKKEKIKSETLTKCFDQTEDWEMTSNYKSNPVMEGPSVFKKDGVYYLFYSANHFRNIDYAVGYATAPTPYGPWSKSKNNPVIHRSIVKEKGSGHGDIFLNKKGVPYYVYHIHNSDSIVTPRRTRIVPLLFKKNRITGIYDITAQKNKVIIPLTDKILGNK